MSDNVPVNLELLNNVQHNNKKGELALIRVNNEELSKY
jgi:hypothetical protein